MPSFFFQVRRGRKTFCQPTEFSIGKFGLDGNFSWRLTLSVIDPGVTEESHNLLQRVAFVKKTVDYVEPDYPEVDLHDEDLMNTMGNEYGELNLEADDDFSIDTSGDVFSIEASWSPVDFQNISL